MTRTLLLRRSLAHYWRTHLGVILGAALGTLVITGALFVGDSVKATLRRQALERVGEVRAAMLAGDRFFGSALAGQTGSTSVLLVRGSVGRADGRSRINQAQVLGINADFWSLAPSPGAAPVLAGAQVLLNRRAAEQLDVAAGETLIVRIEKPSQFSRDAPLSGSENETVALRVSVAGIVDAGSFGNFGLQANQVPPFSIFVPLEFLQERLELSGGANLLLRRAGPPESLRQAVVQQWQIADAGLELRPLPLARGHELRTRRVFLDQAVQKAAPQGVPSLTYLVNEIRSGDRATPYSMATAVDTRAAGLLREPLGPGEAAISQWEADDLGIGVGARIMLKYFVMGERRQLTEKAAEFTVKAVLPMETPGLDSSWMPDFPGLSDKENCRDWEPGFALDTGRIRPEDEAYWEKHRGTPKVFLGLPEGQGMWANRWGDATSIRFGADGDPAQVATAIRTQLTPEQIGFTFVPLRDQALSATDAPVDFGQLFLYFSFFLLAAAAALTGLLFVFSLEQRNEEAGLLLALGWRPEAVRRYLRTEGLLLAVVGSVLGVAAAALYTHLVLRALATVWSRAVGGVHFTFQPQPLTVVIGLFSGVLMAALAMWLASRRQLRQSAGALLASAGSLEAPPRPGRPWREILSALAGAGGLVLLFLPAARTPEGFFGIGSLFLISGIFLVLAALGRQAVRQDTALSLARLGRRNSARRRGRSVATVSVLASGVFMVVAVDAFRQRPEAPGQTRASGTGGFALIAESALPVYEDLNNPQVRDSLGFNPSHIAGIGVLPLRVREGDDASCLNLNRALQPRLLGVKPEELVARGAFRFAGDGAWARLSERSGDAIPGIVDANTLKYALQKKIGDEIAYTDERGTPFTVRLVATLSGSLLQGNILIAEDRFVEKFPGSGGYRFFLVDAPPERAPAIAQELARALSDRGLEVAPASRRLAEFQAVENTYLSIFQALGGLGLLLGSLGLAVVVARNVLERRREFALLEAVGFRARQLRQLVLAEQRWLIVSGLAIGAASALIGVWPSLQERAGGFPYREMLALLLALTFGSLIWVWLATRLALRRPQLPALRSE